MRKAPHSTKVKAKILLICMQKTSKNLEDVKELVLLLKESSENRHLLGGIKHPDMKTVLMVIATHVMILVIGHWIADFMQEVLGLTTIWLDVRHVTMLAILLQIATP